MNNLVVYYWLRYLLKINETKDHPELNKLDIEEIEDILCNMESGNYRREPR